MTPIASPFQNLTRRVLLSAAALSCIAVLAGCPPPAEKADTTGGGTTKTNDLSGTTKGGAATPTSGGDGLTITGSQTLLPLANAWAAEFGKQNPGAKITVSGGGSGQGIAALLNKSADIADASRKIEDKEKATAATNGIAVTEISVAMDGITIIVNPKNSIKSLTLAQLSDIYTGKTKNWKEIGGPDAKIVAYGRENSSGTYQYFKEEVMKKADYRHDVVASAANPPIIAGVGQNAGGIGYLGVAFADDATKSGATRQVPISFGAGKEPVLPTSENVHSGKYPISRALYNYVNGTPSGTTKAYLDFVTGEKGQAIVKQLGYITLK